MKSSVYGASVAACALAAALSMSVAGPHRAYAAPTTYALAQNGDLSISLLSPAPHTSFSGAKPVEIDAFYQSSDSNQITEVDLYIDGVKAAAKVLDAPESKGVISFLIDASALSAGGHSIVVRATAADAEVVSVKGSFVYVMDNSDNENAGLPTVGGDASGAPDLSITSPSDQSRVEGSVRISISAHDPSGGNPYVSYFVDREFKTLRNYPPYDFIWDTTNVPNGLHTVEIYAYNDAQNVGPAKILRLYVNNPGGFTGIRTDLKDIVTPRPARIAAPVLRPKVAKPALLLVVKPAKAAVALPVIAPKTVKPVLGSPKLAPAKASVDAIQTLPTISQSDSVAVGSQTGAAEQPLLSSPNTVTRTSRKSLLAAARMSHVNISLNDTVAPAPETSGTVASISGFEPALTSPFKTIKTATTTKPAVSHKMGAPVVAEAAPIQPQAPTVAAPPMRIASVHLPQDDLSSPFLIAPNMAPQVMKPVTVKPVMVHKSAGPVVVKPVSAHPIAAPIMVKPVITHVSVTPVEVKPVITHVSVVPVPVRPVVVHTHAPAVLVKPVTAHVQIQHASARIITAPAVIKTASLRPMFMPADTGMSVQANLPVVEAKVVKAAAPVQVKTTEIRRISVHVVATPELIKMLRCKGEMAIIIGDRTVHLDRPLAARGSILFGPLRQIFEFEGGQLVWKQATQNVIGESPSRDITLQIGSKNAQVDDKAILLPGAPYLQRGRTMVPMAVLPEMLDANMKYDPTNGHILITSKN